MSRDNSYGWRQHQNPIARELRPKSKLADPTLGMSQRQVQNRQSVEDIERPTSISLPSHLFVPPGAESVDIRVAADIAAGTTVPVSIMSFTAPKGSVTHFIQYGVFSDGSLAANQEFIPRVDGRRAFPYQGDPNNNFKIDLGLAPDLSNSSLIQCQLTLNPGETVEWFVKNLNLVDIAMGVRMVGYVDYSQKRTNARSGG